MSDSSAGLPVLPHRPRFLAKVVRDMGRDLRDDPAQTGLSVLLHWPLAKSAGRGEGEGIVFHTAVLRTSITGYSEHLEVYLTTPPGACVPSCGQGWCDLTLMVRHSTQISEVPTNSFCQRKKTNLSKRNGLAVFWDNYKELTTTQSFDFSFVSILQWEKRQAIVWVTWGYQQKSDLQIESLSSCPQRNQVRMLWSIGFGWVSLGQSSLPGFVNDLVNPQTALPNQTSFSFLHKKSWHLMKAS